jgi:hypothetical protein
MARRRRRAAFDVGLNREAPADPPPGIRILGHNQKPPAGQPRGLYVVRRPLPQFDDEAIKAFDIPAFLRRRGGADLQSAIASARKRSPREREQSPAMGPAMPPSPDQPIQVPSAAEPEVGNRQLNAFLADLDFGGGPVLSRELLAKHGIVIEGRSNRSFDMAQAARHLDVLLTGLPRGCRVRSCPPPQPATTGTLDQ